MDDLQHLRPTGAAPAGASASVHGETLSPADPGWHSYIEAPLVVDTEPLWADTADVVVVGFGGAGASTALQAREAGADVLIIDRFTGGGATAASGGVIYAANTPYQREAGFDDTAEAMFNYLQVEAQGVVKDSTLRKFCEESAANLEWVHQQGANYASAFYKEKTVYPPEGKFLYYAGNELLPRNQAISKPAPRGHRTVGKGLFCGAVLYQALRKSALAKGARLMQHAPVVRLVTDRAGNVLGVEAKRLPPGSKAYKTHDKQIRQIDNWGRFLPPRVKKLNVQLQKLEQDEGERVLIRARGGVVLSAGGFAFNQQLVDRYAPLYSGSFSIGSAGCDGSGIRLGQSVGGVARKMDSIAATRAIAPPPEFIQGIIVDDDAKRFVEEDAYASTLGRKIADHRSKKNYLIIDEAMHKAAYKVARRFEPGWLLLNFPVLRTLWTNCVGAKDLPSLARKIGLDPVALQQTMREYEEGVARHEDPFGKNPHYLRKLEGKLYAIDVSPDNKNTTCMIFTIGGLAVEEETGHVLRPDGQPIKGLFAAGRTAIGIPSQFYVSGTSIADCVFSGRRAGSHAAQAALQRNAA